MTTIVTRTNKTTELNYANGDANISRDILTAASDPAPGLAHNRSVYECNGTFDFTLPVADDMIYDGVNSSLANDYEITIKNVGSGTITVKTSSTDTLDGVAATGDQAIPENQSFTYKVNNGKDGWVSVAKVSHNAISSDAAMADNMLVRGDGTGRKVQKTGISVADTTDNMNTNGGSITAGGGFVGDITGNADTVTSFTPAGGSLTLAGADALTLTTSAATNVTLPTTGTLLANMSEDSTPQLGGDLDCQGNTVGFTQQTIAWNAVTTTVNWGTGNKASMTFGAGNIGTFAFTNPSKPGNFILKIVQDATGSRTVTAWDADILWAGGSAPTLTTDADAIDIVSFYWDGTNYFGVASLDFS